MKKKFLVMLLALIMVFSTAACGGGGAEGGSGDSSGGDQVYKFKFGTQYAPAHPAVAAMNRIKEDIEKNSNNRIEITIFPSSQLGDWATDVFEGMMKGAVEMALIPVPSQYDDRLQIATMPYLVSEYSQLEKAYGSDSSYFEFVTGVCEELNVKFFGAYAEGFISYGGVREPEADYAKVGDKPGIYRSMGVKLFQDTIEAMGYPTTVIPYSDLYTSLQTGIVDGWFGGTPMANYQDQRDVIKYFIPYNIVPESASFFMSKQVYDRLPEDLQKVVRDACVKESSYSFQTCEDFDNEAMKKMEDYGIKILPITAEEREAIGGVVRTAVWPDIEAIVGKDVVDSIKKDVGVTE